MMAATLSVNVLESIHRNRSAQQFVSSFLRDLDPRACFDATSLLAENPDVAATKAAVLDLALEDYCRREAAGQTISPEDFARQFPRHAPSILHLLQLRQFLEANGEELARAAPTWPKVGEEWLGFQLIEELGRGARSHVYLAVQPAVGDRFVVLKATPDSLTEANALGRLAHPHIVAIHSVQSNEQRGLSAICMPYLGRATLNDLLIAIPPGAIPADSKAAVAAVDAINADALTSDSRSRATPRGYVDLVIDIGRQLASALEYTHAKGICHFDIKPTNVLIAADGIARLIDFNLAALTTEQSFGGTVPYMSPEQLRRHLGQSSAAVEGPHSDIYSLGVLLYELLTGRHPFRSFSTQENRQQAAEELLHRQQQVMPSLRTGNSLLNRGLDTVVRSCLDADPAQRPDAAHLRRLLERELETWSRFSRWSLQHRRSVRCSTAAAGLLAAASLTHLATREPEAHRALHQAVRYEEAGEFVQAEARFSAGIAADPTLPALWFGRGKCRLELQRFEAAQRDFEQARDLGGDTAASSAYAAYCLCQLQRNWKQPIELFESAQDLGLSSAGLWNNLAYCYYKIGDYRRANEYIHKCIAADQVCGESLYILARLKIVSAIEAKDRDIPVQVRQLLADGRHALAMGLSLGYESADLHFDRALLAALEATISDGDRDAAIEQINLALSQAFALGLNGNRLNELPAIWPELANRLVLPGKPVTQVQSRPPVVDPFWSPATVGVAVVDR